MKALILAGGQGTRLRPLTYTTPKPLLPIANRPHLGHILDLVRRHGIAEATLLTGYGADRFEAFEAPAEVALGFSLESVPLGTCGPVKLVESSLDGTFLCFNGDILSSVDLTAMIAQHRATAAVATLYLFPVDDASQYGLVPLDPDGRVTHFIEKPSAEEAAGGGLINAGVYVLEPEILKYVPPGKRWSFERELFPTLLDEGLPVFGFVSETYWNDIGTPDRFLQAHWDVIEGRVPGVSMTQAKGLRVSANAIGPRVSLGDRCLVAAGARVESTVALPGCRIEPEAIVRNSILGNNVQIEARVVLDGVILGDGVQIGAGNTLRNVRMAPGITLPAGALS